MTNAPSFRRRPAARVFRARTPLLAAAFLLAAGCRDGGDRPDAPDGDVGGTVVIATPADPGSLLPPLSLNTQAKAINALLFDHLAEIGDSLTAVNDVGFRPRLAERWTWAPDSMSIAFHLNPKARWHDGKPVRGEDVRFTFDVYTDPAVGSTYAPLLSNIDSVSVPDSTTATFWYKRRSPLQFFDAVYQMAILPSHLLAGASRAELAASPVARQPVGTGRFRFVRWEANQRVELAADLENYRGRPNLDRVIWSVAPDHGSAAIKLFSGEADFFETVRPDNFAQVAGNKDLRLAPYPSQDYGFLQFNLRARDGSRRPHPVFAERETRRALTMGIDRTRLVQSVYDTLGYPGFGPTTRSLFPRWASLKQIPYDPARARQLLDSLGWTDADGDGVRERAGVPLEFSILVPSTSAARKRYGVLLQEVFRAMGARVQVEEQDIAGVVSRMNSGGFDALVGSWNTDPSRGGARQTWSVAASRAPKGSNFGSYESPAFDAAVESALTSLDPARSLEHWARAYQIIIDDAPAVWLYEPRLVAGAHRRLNLVGMRADGWWAGIPDWSIARGQRIARDRVGQ